MANGVEHFFMCAVTIYILFGKVCVQLVCQIGLFFFFFTVEFREFFYHFSGGFQGIHGNYKTHPHLFFPSPEGQEEKENKLLLDPSEHLAACCLLSGL